MQQVFKRVYERFRQNQCHVRAIYMDRKQRKLSAQIIGDLLAGGLTPATLARLHRATAGAADPFRDMDKDLADALATLAATEKAARKLSEERGISAGDAQFISFERSLRRAVAAEAKAPVAPAAAPRNPSAAATLLQRFNAITDPADRTEFYRLHRSALRVAQR